MIPMQSNYARIVLLSLTAFAAVRVDRPLCCPQVRADPLDQKVARVVLVAGGGDRGDGVAATIARIQAPFGIDFDKRGNLYFVELTGQRVCRIDPQGVLTT